MNKYIVGMLCVTGSLYAPKNGADAARLVDSYGDNALHQFVQECGERPIEEWEIRATFNDLILKMGPPALMERNREGKTPEEILQEVGQGMMQTHDKLSSQVMTARTVLQELTRKFLHIKK